MAQPFVLQLENHPGELARMTRALAVRGIDIRHIAAVSAGRHMCAILTTDDEEATREVLRGIGVPFVESPALHVEVADRPGALADISERLRRHGVAVEGILVAGCHGGVCDVALTVDDEAKARQALGLPPAKTLVGAA